jgi:HlyD family secretion protein
MKTLLRSAFPVGLSCAIVSIVLIQLRPDFELTAPSWKAERAAALRVKLAEAARDDLFHVVQATGKVEAEVEVKISAEVSGRIANLTIREGDRVTRNQLLVQLDLTAFEAEVRSAEAKVRRIKASIASSEASCAKAQRDFDLNSRLFSKNAVEMIAYKDAETALKKEHAQLDMVKQDLVEAESTLTKAKEDLRKATTLSPITGVVSQLSAKQGEVVLVGTMNNPGTVMMTVSNPDNLVVRTKVDETNVALVHPGQKAFVHFQSGEHWRLAGTVKRISPKGSKPSPTDPVGSSDVTTFETIIQLVDPPPQVRMEMTSNVEILVSERKGVLTVPSQAVLHRRLKDLPQHLRALAESDYSDSPQTTNNTRRYHQVVFVASGGVAECRLVRTGISDRGRAEVLQGLSQGERVVAGPYRSLEKLRDGMPLSELDEADENEGTP